MSLKIDILRCVTLFALKHIYLGYICCLFIFDGQTILIRNINNSNYCEVQFFYSRFRVVKASVKRGQQCCFMLRGIVFFISPLLRGPSVIDAIGWS